MKALLILFFGGISFLSYGQENALKSISIEWERLSAPLFLNEKESHKKNYKLQEIDLSIDLRKQHLRKNFSMMQLPENPFIQQQYTAAILQPTVTGKISFTISGNGYTNSNIAGSIKNTAYKDASLYSGLYYPITGAAY